MVQTMLSSFFSKNAADEAELLLLSLVVLDTATINY